MIRKDRSITRLLERLRARLGAAAFDVVDYSEGDLCATGVALPDNHGVLVYISTFGKLEDEYFVSLELPPRPGDKQWANHAYTPAGEHHVEGFDKLAQIIQRHFNCGRAS